VLLVRTSDARLASELVNDQEGEMSTAAVTDLDLRVRDRVTARRLVRAVQEGLNVGTNATALTPG
jgi:hypothetical protein